MADRKKMEGHCSTGQSPQWAVVPIEEEEIIICPPELEEKAHSNTAENDVPISFFRNEYHQQTSCRKQF